MKRRTTPPMLFRYSRRVLVWGWVAIMLVLLPHLGNMPPVILVGCLMIGIFWLWRVVYGTQPWLPGIVVQFLLLCLSLWAIMATYGPFVGRESATALLVCLAFLKLLELRRERDLYVAILMGFFLLVAQFFYSQSLLQTLYAFVCALVLTRVLMLNHRPDAPSKILWNQAVTLLLQALPLTGFLFLLIPRLQGPLWTIPLSNDQAMTGLSESMEPGSISQLVHSQKVAFRVQFLTSPPHLAQMYWRGPVLWRLQGETWSTLATPLPYAPPAIRSLGPEWVYQVTMEPSPLKIMFALEFPNSAPQGGRLNRERQVVSAKPIQAPIRYTVISRLGFQDDEPLLESEESLALALPKSGNPRARSLAQSWRNTFSNPEDIVREGLNFLGGNHFVYTLAPPRLFENAIDGFLFDTRKGFCEHFAGAFTFLMRASGVAARVVTGYQGGTLNPLGDHLTVRNADAHAWSEVWLPDQGWVRIDPTTVVSPTRVERGIGEALAAEEKLPQVLNPNNHFLQQWRNVWDLVDHDWNQFVLGFDTEKQRAFWSALGWDQPQSWELIVVIIVTVAVFPLILSLWVRMRHLLPRVHDPHEVMVQQFYRKLAKVGVVRAPWEGVLTYGERAGTLLPQQCTAILTIAKACSQLRYEKSSSPAKVKALRSKIRAFRPKLGGKKQ